MRYIKTKDGIYEVISEILDGEAYRVKVPRSKWDYDEDNGCYYEDSKIDAFHKKDVIKEADTIEELCDEMIMVSDFKKPLVSGNWNITRDITKTILIDSQKVGIKVYGGIWTDKGLMYVAKMNDEGKLCLI